MRNITITIKVTDAEKVKLTSLDFENIVDALVDGITGLYAMGVTKIDMHIEDDTDHTIDDYSWKAHG